MSSSCPSVVWNSVLRGRRAGQRAPDQAARAGVAPGAAREAAPYADERAAYQAHVVPARAQGHAALVRGPAAERGCQRASCPPGHAPVQKAAQCGKQRHSDQHCDAADARERSPHSRVRARRQAASAAGSRTVCPSWPPCPGPGLLGGVWTKKNTCSTAAAGGARGRHCLRASLQLPGLAPQAICARLTTETARFSVARRSVPAGLAYTPVLD